MSAHSRSPRLASRRDAAVAMRCVALRRVASRCVALRCVAPAYERFTSARAAGCPFTPFLNTTPECVYFSSPVSPPYTLPRRRCLVATSTHRVVFALGTTGGKLSVSLPPPSRPATPLFAPLRLSLFLSAFHHLTASPSLSLSPSPCPFFYLLLCLARYLITSHDPSLATTAKRDGRDANGANFRSRIDFLSGSSRRHRSANSRFSRAALR